MATASVLEVCIRFSRVSKKKDTCDRLNSEMASRCGGCTGQRRWGEKRWLLQKTRCGNFFMNSSRVVKSSAD